MTLSANKFHRRRRRAFALVVVLIILTLLAVISVGFLASMSAERTTANAFSNKTKAEQAAQAGVDSAMATLREYFKSFPDSATVWDTQQSTSDDTTSPNNEGTSLYLRAVASQTDASAPDPDADNTPNNIDSSSGADKRSVFVLPLVSGAVVQPVTSKIKAINNGDTMVTDPTKAASNSFINLNSRRYLKDKDGLPDIQGWVGSSPDWTNPVSGAPTTPKPVRVPWVEVKRQDGVTVPANAPVIARYAYWVEDESFRANVNYAQQGDKANDHVRSDNMTNGLIPLDASYARLIGPLAALGYSASDETAKSIAQSLFEVRAIYPSSLFPESRAYVHATSLDSKLAERLRFLTTTQSTALNLSRHGFQRVNLNSVVDPATSPTDVAAIQRQIDKIVNTINTYAPNFGQRFYRTRWTRASQSSPPVPDDYNAKQVTAEHALIYLYKIAANIRDYIDNDAIPTVIQKQGAKGVVRPTNRPTETMNFNEGENPYWAVGKDAAPFMSECAVHFSGDVTGGRYTLNTDYYIELWNMSTQSVSAKDLGTNAFIRIINPTSWVATKKGESVNNGIPITNPEMGATPSSRKARDADIDISKVVFPPGVATVITTDPVATNPQDPGYAALIAAINPDLPNRSETTKNLVHCDFITGTRTYKGAMPKGSDNVVRVELKMQGGATSSSDYETEVLIGTDNGYIDSLAGSLPFDGNPTIPVASTARVLYGGYLRGNLAAGTYAPPRENGGLQPCALGDPRTNNEQLVYNANPSNTADRTRYLNHDTNPAGKQQVTPTLGEPNYRSVAPEKEGNPGNPWPDYYKFPGGVTTTLAMKADNAPSVMLAPSIPSEKVAGLKSIGQLGDIFDPARLSSTSGSDITLSHGGGRTLKIGQHDDRYEGLASSTSSSWASWRLTDIFSAADPAYDPIEQPGLININGVTRDNGAALYAALTGFKFQPVTPSNDPTVHGDAQLANRPKDDAETRRMIKAVVDSIVDNRLKNTDLTKPGPFFERGELSETPIFNPAITPPTSLVDGVDFAQTFDHSREEIFRRLVGMTTTRGNVFTVYAIGQSITQSNPTDAATKRVTGSHQMKVTFRLVPKNKSTAADGSATDFHPGIDDAGKDKDFDPKPDSAAFVARFAKPDHYDIQILSASSGL